MAIQCRDSWYRVNPSNIGIEVRAKTDIFAVSLSVERADKGGTYKPVHSDGIVDMKKGDLWKPAQSPWAVGADKRCQLLLGALNNGAKVDFVVTIDGDEYKPYSCTAGDEFLTAKFRLLVG